MSRGGAWLGKFENCCCRISPSVCVSSESWLLFSVVSDPSHGYVTPLIRQSMSSLEREENVVGKIIL